MFLQNLKWYGLDPTHFTDIFHCKVYSHTFYYFYKVTELNYDRGKSGKPGYACIQRSFSSWILRIHNEMKI